VGALTSCNPMGLHGLYLYLYIYIYIYIYITTIIHELYSFLHTEKWCFASRYCVRSVSLYSHWTDLCETRHQHYAIQPQFSAVNVNSLREATRAQCTYKVVRWEPKQNGRIGPWDHCAFISASGSLPILRHHRATPI
jgi:hypothetical protein